jgi:tetratricopeptide (TPR) repeat protein
MNDPVIAKVGDRLWRLPRPSWRAVGLGAGAAALLAALGAGGWYWSQAQERRAEAAYAGPLSRLTSQPATQPGTERDKAVQELEAALAQYPSSSLAPLAAYELGNVRYSQRDYARARALYEVAMTRAESPTVRLMASVGLGYGWEAERNFAKAGEVYQSALSGAKPGDFQYGDLLLDLARVQAAASRNDDAVATYRRYLKEFPGSPRADEIKARLARLGAAP